MSPEKVGAYWVVCHAGITVKAKTPERAMEKWSVLIGKHVAATEDARARLYRGWVEQWKRANELNEQLHCAMNAVKKAQGGQDFMDVLSETFALSKRIDELEARLAKYENPFAHNE